MASRLVCSHLPWEIGFVLVHGGVGSTLHPHGSQLQCLVPCQVMPGTGSERRQERVQEGPGGGWLRVADADSSRAGSN